MKVKLKLWFSQAAAHTQFVFGNRPNVAGVLSLKMHKVIDMFEGRPRMQRILRLGLLGVHFNPESDEDNYEDWGQDRGGFRGDHTRSASSVYHPPLQYYSSARDISCPASVISHTYEPERKESKKNKGKADKKRLKKQRQKEKKRLEKMKEKQSSENNEEEKDDSQLPKADENKPVNDKYEASFNPSVSKDGNTSDSSDASDEDDDDDDDDVQSDSEGLDMTSSFVNKAALIAMRKMEQRPKSERKEKKKSPDKEEAKPTPLKPSEEQEVEQKDCAASSSFTFEDNVKTSTELANMGNKFASAGNLNMAVKYFTDAIKFNPTEYKLFGNRSFCFEKLQEYEKALADAELSLGLCPGWVKGLFRKGRALAGLKRYEEAAQTFRDVLKVDRSCTDAAQELMRVQIIQIMEFGFTREQSSNALIIHGTVKKALEVLSKLHPLSEAVQSSSLPTVQVANTTGVSPILSANTLPPAAAAHTQTQDPVRKTPLGPVHNTPGVHSQPQPVKPRSDYKPPAELFPVWVGNLNYPVPPSVIADLFNKAGFVYSVKVLSIKRCAFVNFTKQEHCDEAIRRFHGYELSGMKLAVRYPDRIPPGMGISKSAHKADHLHDENIRENEDVDGSGAGHRPVLRPHKHGLRGNY